ncbi:hypothetical protein [Chloracidobacterium thermophilum]|nr:hypothetical protein [Chloracidobacterium thermophilum]
MLLHLFIIDTEVFLAQIADKAIVLVENSHIENHQAGIYGEHLVLCC